MSPLLRCFLESKRSIYSCSIEIAEIMKHFESAAPARSPLCDVAYLQIVSSAFAIRLRYVYDNLTRTRFG